ncbi:MAG: 16S rRNA (cytosine(967)-C(5))-methyltransferase RsmB [Bacteroides sp.]|nr:16S rRNA (cytosine(967)-C(5))-methyltransferase RsmB [Bacillota bacterium]MCM1394314.1 16S rRNA (cytosine(967)-C(5))-methyltransferase RsmB [[Eubacterium] siraeum]MCM1455661.1 16S rRNA (cytosine(967)-C(5))-methyltransferase RsmB [Bacteroides sp.]
MKRHILQAHRILTRIEGENAYSNMAFYSEDVSDMATLLVYGVLENALRIDYILSELVDKRPQRAINVLLKIGVYALENLTDVPKFAIVSECVESAKAIGKGGASGFVNAVLKKVANGDYTLPSKDDDNYLSVTYSKPQWFIDKLKNQYGYEKTLEIITAKSEHLEHIRPNLRLTTAQSILDELNAKGEKCKLSEVGGIIARGTPIIKRLFDKGLVTYQSPSSMLAVQALAPQSGGRILDICSAPGGKAVYASEICRDGEIVACELHPHRINLIEKYKKRMRADNVTPVQCDATVYKPEWKENFDRVLADVPCSCFGTFLKHPDVFLSRGEKEIETLAATQKLILKNAGEYVKKGGILIYSTCTLFEEENDAVVSDLLKSGKFEPVHISALDGLEGGIYIDNGGSAQILPHGEYDGFYIAKLRKL